MAAFDKEYKKLESVITHLTELEDNLSLPVNQVELEMRSLQGELQDITDYVGGKKTYPTNRSEYFRIS